MKPLQDRSTNHGPKNSDFDVLSLIGGQAQKTKHEGNLNFKAICEKNLSAYFAEDADKDAIIGDVVAAISAKGGRFLKKDGNEMEESKVYTKVKDCFRQMQKPKVAKGRKVGDNDVVISAGARSHIYPGNAAYHTLTYALAPRYHPNLFDDSTEEDSIDQEALRCEIINHFEGRGGVFRGSNEKRISIQEVHEKIHQRMKDIKRDIKRFQDPKDEDSREANTLSRMGCTSTKSTVTISRNTASIDIDDHSDSDSSFDSQCLDDDGSDDGENEDADAIETKIISKEALTRDERLKHRNYLKSLSPDTREKIMQQARPKRAKKRPRKEESDEEPEEEEVELSDYEKMREQKVKRNLAKLRELGLA